MQPVVEASQHRLRIQQSDPRCGELDGQGQPVQSTTDLGHHARGVVTQLEVAFTAWARSTNNRTDSGSCSGSTASSCSPETRKAARS